MLQVALADPDASAESLRAACQQVLQLGERQEGLVNALLALATSQSGLRQREPFDLAEVTARVLDSRRPAAARRGVRVAASLYPVIVTGDPHLAEGLVGNLLDNAVRHNVPGGKAQVTTGTHAGRPYLSICNSGPVVPPGEVARLLEPFQQLDGDRTRHDGGYGLGLVIIAAVASAHGADLAVRANPGGGLGVTVTFRAPLEEGGPGRPGVAG